MRAKIFAIAIVLLVVACNKARNKESVDSLKREIDQVEAATGRSNFQTTDTVAFPGNGPVDSKQQSPAKKMNEYPDWDKKIIKNANLSIEVESYDNYYKVLRDRVKAVGGYISQEEQSKNEYKVENTVVIKVPVDQFDNAVSLFSSAEKNVKERRITSQDVSAEYVDTRSRIEAKKQVRLRYMDLLNQAKNMEEILSVQSEINVVQEEIEAATGRINYLGHAASFSTINLTFYQVLNETAQENNEPSFWKKAGLAFKAGGRWVVDLFIALVTIWPLLICIGLGFIIVRKTRSKKAGVS